MHLNACDSHSCRVMSASVRRVVLCALGALTLAVTACGEFEPIVEPDVDLQLTLDTLRTQVRDAQRNLAEVRAELESRRQELADAQVARAQLEGRVREAERRVSEARQVIEVQREELLAARAERERVFRSSSHLNSQRQFQKRSTKPGAPPITDPAAAPVPTGASLQWSFGAPSLSATPAFNPLPDNRATAPALRQNAPIKEIIVRPGDTLYSIARTYRIDLNHLRSLNHLQDNHILVGQTLWVAEE